MDLVPWFVGGMPDMPVDFVSISVVLGEGLISLQVYPCAIFP